MKNVKTYNDWIENPHSMPKSIDESIKHVYSYEEVGELLAEKGVIDFVKSFGNKVKELRQKMKRAQENIRKKVEQGKEAIDRAKNFMERAKNATDPIAQKINTNRASEEAMVQKIKTAEAKLIQIKQQLTVSQEKTTALKLKRAEGAN